MGLDMFLRGKRFLSRYSNPNDKEVISEINKKFPELSDWQEPPIQEIIIEVAYWRKANAIHRWFVENVQDGIDNCGYYYVSREKLEELRELCIKALKGEAAARRALPTESGFFFGSTDYDEWYFKSIEDTIQSINKALTLPSSWDFEYHSSW